MEDIAPKLLEKIQAEFTKRIDSDENIKRLYELVRNGAATYQEANKFAIQVGKLLSRTFGDTLSSEVLPDGKLYYNIAQRILNPMLQKNYDLVSEVCTEVQTTMNKAAGLGIAVKKPEINQDRVQGIIDIVSGKESFDDIAYMLKEPIVNFSQSIAADFVKENVEFQGKAGLTPQIVRKAIGHCCEWCSNLEGIYDYPDVPKDVYRRHRYCRCMVVYNPADGKRRVQNVHTKQWNSEEENDKIIRQRIAKELELEHGLAAQIAEHPKLLQSYTPETLKKALEDAGYEVKPLGSKSKLNGISFEQGGGYRVYYGGDKYFQYHPEKGSHHGGPYYKTSSGKPGTKWYDLEGDEIDIDETGRTGKQVKKKV
jgi:hypothetical protein